MFAASKTKPNRKPHTAQKRAYICETCGGESFLTRKAVANKPTRETTIIAKFASPTSRLGGRNLQREMPKYNTATIPQINATKNKNPLAATGGTTKYRS